MTDEEWEITIREAEWQSGINALENGCQDIIDEIHEARMKGDITTLKALHFRGKTRFPNELAMQIANFSVSKYEVESPIERLFLEAFDAIRTEGKETMYHYWLNPQVEIDKYRVDFELVNNYDKKIIVECDGYDFHQKTKEQVKNDNQRERDLKKLGYEVVRFSGSEIFEDAEKCVRELLDIMRN